MAFILITPAMVLILVFFLFPILSSLRLSFTDWNGIPKALKFTGLDNYRYIIKEKSFITVVFNTLYLAVLFVPVLNALSIVIAVLIVNVSRKIGNFYKSILFFPNILSMVVVGFVWKLIYSYNNGLINVTLRSLKLDFLAFDWLGRKETVLPAMSLSIIWFSLGYYLVIYIAGLMAVPTELYEASSIDGASPLQKFFRITLPMLAPAITINVVLATLHIISEFDIPFVLTGGGPGYLSETIALQIYHYAFTSRLHGPSLALAVLLGIFSIVVALAELKILLKREDVFQ